MLGLKAIYQRAKLPQSLYPGFRTAFDVAREAQYDGGDHDRERFARRVIERVLTQYDGIDPDNLDYLMRKLEQYTANAG
jgi:CBS-domain-containing membrane protein